MDRKLELDNDIFVQKIVPLMREMCGVYLITRDPLEIFYLTALVIRRRERFYK